LGLAGLLLLVTVGGLSVVLRHHVPLDGDPLISLLGGVALRDALSEPTGEAFAKWIQQTGYRPPLPSLLAQPLMFLLSDQTLAVRLTEHLLFLLCIWLVYSIGVKLSGRPAGLLAALLFAAHPTIQGLSRLGNADPVIWFSLLLLLRVLVTLDLRSTRQAAALGLAAGLCLATRLLCLVFLVGPVLWLLAFKVRTWRSGANLLLAGALSLAPAGWWYALQQDWVLQNMAMSSQTQQQAGPLNTMMFYLRYGWAFVLAGVAPAAWLAWRRRALEPRLLWLVLAWLVPAGAQLVLLWDMGDRYPMPAIPVCSLLVAVTLVHLTRAWRRRVAAWGALAALGVAPLVFYYSPGELWPHGAEGLMVPDDRAHDGLFRATASVPAGEFVVNINDSDLLFYARGIVLNRNPPPVRLVQLEDLESQDPGTRTPRYVLRTIRRCELVPNRYCEPPRRPNRWWAEVGRRLPGRSVALTRDPNGVEFQLWRLARRLDLTRPTSTPF